MRLLAAVLISIFFTMVADAQVGAPIGSRTGINLIPFPLGPSGPTGQASFVPPSGNNLLLEDGSSILLLEDGTSNLCLESGC